MNRIIEDTLKERFNYCHVLEVHDLYELQSLIDQIYDSYINEKFYGVQYTKKEVFEFINTLEIYCLDDDNEKEIYDFNINNYLIQNYG
jgi:hypothetical protein